MDYEQAVDQGLITLMGEETDETFLSQRPGPGQRPEAVWPRWRTPSSMVYTPFHGTRIPAGAGRRWAALGMKHLHLRAGADGHRRQLPHRGLPQPGERRRASPWPMELAKKVDADLILGTDPDADRVGIMVRGTTGRYVPALPATRRACCCWTTSSAPESGPGTMPDHPVALKTIVTTDMARVVAESQRGEVLRHLHRLQVHGGEEERSWRQPARGKVIFSYEESYRLHARATMSGTRTPSPPPCCSRRWRPGTPARG